MKIITGRVVSNKQNKTVIVERTIQRAHPVYKKIVKRDRRDKVHTEIPLELGDMVSYVSCRPISKDKHYKVQSKISK